MLSRITLLVAMGFTVLSLASRELSARCVLTSPDNGPLDASEEPHAFFLESERTSRLYREIIAADTLEVFNISGNVRFAGSVLKADHVVFTENSVLELLDTDAPFWAIVADTLTFRGNGIQIIRSADYSIEQSEAGSGGTNGLAYYGRNGNGDGRAGGSGGNGSPGARGNAKELPCLFVLAGRLEVIRVEEPVVLRLPGIDGGRGGNGGPGGDGGRGEDGANASGSPLCRREPRDGGAGGDAGDGGRAGDGGAGGRGGDVIFVGDLADGREFMSFTILNEGGAGGSPGLAGSPGKSGQGGDRGHRNGRPCFRSSSHGAAGASGKAGSQGQAGETGVRGTEQIVVIEDLSFLFSRTSR